MEWMDSAPAIASKERSPDFIDSTDPFADARFKDARFVKAQLAGPWTLLCTVAADLLDDQVAEWLQVSARHIGRIARRTASWIQERSPRTCGALVVIDEPILPEGLRGCDYLRPLFAEIRRGGAGAGIHCCGHPPFDALVSQDPDVISFDALSYGESFFQSDAARDWLARGGRVAAGLAPTDRGQSPSEVVHIAKEWRSRAENTSHQTPWAVTATCGVGLRTPSVAHQVFESTNRIARALR